jgi:hypothetical protein
MISIRLFAVVLLTVAVAGCTDLPDYDDPRMHEAETAADSCDDLLVNGDFDDGAVGWKATPADIIYDDAEISPTIRADSGDYFAWLGGEFSVTRSISQEIQLPTNVTVLKLRGKYSVAAETESGPVEDTFKLELYNSAGMLQSTPLMLNNTAWTISGDGIFEWSDLDVTINAGAVAGQRALLRLISTNDGQNNTNFLFDSLSLRGSACP